MITVVNKKHHEPNDIDIYIGRGSPLGNPKPISFEVTREEAIAYYKDYLPEKIKSRDRKICDELNRIYRKARIGNVNLVCFCKPENCHGDFIKTLLEEQIEIDKFKNGIFALKQRRFGFVSELMIRRMHNFEAGKNHYHDLYDNINGKRVEVKFSVPISYEESITQKNVLECIKSAATCRKPISFNSWNKYKFDCNIQQIKSVEFDILYYGLFFSDCVKIFLMPSCEIKGLKGYSDKQHKGNVGEGQFHITEKNIEYHIANFYYKTISYEELYKLIKL